MVSIQQFIESVKHELLAYQLKHRGEPAYLALQHVELEAALTVTSSGEGGVKVFVAEGKLNASSEVVHRVKLTFSVQGGEKAPDQPISMSMHTGKCDVSGVLVERTIKLPGSPVQPFGTGFKPQLPGGEISPLDG